MLELRDQNGIALTPDSTAQSYRVRNVSAVVPVTVSALIVEPDPYLASGTLSGTLDWNDGSIPSVYRGVGTVNVSSTRSLRNGNYAVELVAFNSKAPVPDTAGATFTVVVSAPDTGAAPLSLIYGPILPKSVGYPNEQQWQFNSSSDLDILESSVRMLLLTAKGERLMNPDYGTNIRRILFESTLNGVEGLVQEEIVTALTTYEPRLSLEAITVDRTSVGTYVVIVVLSSRITNETFTTNLDFSRESTSN